MQVRNRPSVIIVDDIDDGSMPVSRKALEKWIENVNMIKQATPDEILEEKQARAIKIMHDPEFFLKHYFPNYFSNWPKKHRKKYFKMVKKRRATPFDFKNRHLQPPFNHRRRYPQSK